MGGVESSSLPASISRYLRLVEQRPGLFAQSEAIPLVLDGAEMARFSAEAGREVGVVYESPWHLMVVDVAIDAATGEPFAYERVIPASTGAPVVAIPRRGESYVLLRQYRHAIRSEQLAFPRGYGEEGLSGEENARKEVFEELGAEVLGAVPLGEVHPDSGLSSMVASVYLCDVGDLRPSDDEGILGAVELSSAEFAAEIAAGHVDDGFTLSAWALLTVLRHGPGVWTGEVGAEPSGAGRA